MPPGAMIRSGSEKPLAGLAIMVVDDDSDILFMIEQLLRSRGARQVWAETSVRPAMASIVNKQTCPDIILSDYNMSPINGLQFLKAVRSGINKHLPPSTPFILITGYGDLDAVKTAKALNVDALIAKPASIQRILAAVQTAKAKINVELQPAVT